MRWQSLSSLAESVMMFSLLMLLLQVHPNTEPERAWLAMTLLCSAHASCYLCHFLPQADLQLLQMEGAIGSSALTMILSISCPQ